MLLPLKLGFVRAGRTQRSAAQAIGISERRMSDLVLGLVEARPEERRALAAFLQCPENELFDSRIGDKTAQDADRV
jgi:hypothetical protein